MHRKMVNLLESSPAEGGPAGLYSHVYDRPELTCCGTALVSAEG